MRAFTSSVASSASYEASNVDTVPEQSCSYSSISLRRSSALALTASSSSWVSFRLVPCSGLGLQVVGSLFELTKVCLGGPVLNLVGDHCLPPIDVKVNTLAVPAGIQVRMHLKT
jgi:hypothetical protein